MLAADIVIIPVVYVAALMLRYDFNISLSLLDFEIMLVVGLVMIALNYSMGMYRAIVRFMGTEHSPPA